MKKFKLRGLAAILAATMVLSACGTSDPEPTTTPAAPAASATTTSAAPAEMEEVDLTVEVFDRGDYPAPSTATDNPLSRWVIENVKTDLNINLEFVPVPRSQEYDKLNIMMAGGTAPDIVFTYNISAPANFSKDGGLTELTPYIEEFGPNIKEDNAEQLPYGVFNDGQYAIPAKRVNDNLKHGTYIRKDILDKHSLPVPTTKADFYTTLTTIKASEPDLIPYVMGETKYERYYENFVMSYVQYADEKEFYTYGSDATRLISPGAKEGYRELNKWYNEGLISPDFAIDKESKQMKVDISTGKAFSFTDDIRRPLDDKLIQTASSTVPGLQYTITNAFENHEGKYYYNAYEPIGLYIMVPKASEDKAGAAVRYIDWMLQDDNIATLKNGVELGAAEFNEDGVIISKNPDELAALGIKDNMFSDIGIIQSRYEYDDPAKFQMADNAVYSTDTFDSSQIVTDMYKAKEGEGFYTVARLDSIPEAEAKYGNDIRTSIQSMSSRLIVAPPEEFDALWEAEYDQLLTAGLQSVLDERAAAYDAMQK